VCDDERLKRLTKHGSSECKMVRYFERVWETQVELPLIICGHKSQRGVKEQVGP